MDTETNSSEQCLGVCHFSRPICDLRHLSETWQENAGKKPPLLFEVGRALTICKKNLFNFCGATVFGLGGLACLFWRGFGTWEETPCQLLEHVLL